MRRRSLTLALALTALAAPATAAHASSLVDVRADDRASARLIEALPGVESTGHDSVVATAQGVRLLRAAGLEPRVRIADLEASDRADRRADRAYAAQGASPLPSGRSSYRRLGDYDADLARLARGLPEAGQAADACRRPRWRDARCAAWRSATAWPAPTASRCS